MFVFLNHCWMSVDQFGMCNHQSPYYTMLWYFKRLRNLQACFHTFIDSIDGHTSTLHIFAPFGSTIMKTPYVTFLPGAVNRIVKTGTNFYKQTEFKISFLSGNIYGCSSLNSEESHNTILLDQLINPVLDYMNPLHLDVVDQYLRCPPSLEPFHESQVSIYHNQGVVDFCLVHRQKNLCQSKKIDIPACCRLPFYTHQNKEVAQSYKWPCADAKVVICCGNYCMPPTKMLIRYI